MINNSAKRRETAISFVSEMVINLAKEAEKSKINKAYYNELVDAMTMAAHILKTVPENSWRLIDYNRKEKVKND